MKNYAELLRKFMKSPDVYKCKTCYHFLDASIAINGHEYDGQCTFTGKYLFNGEIYVCGYWEGKK